MDEKRPVGVTVSAIFVIIWGLINICFIPLTIVYMRAHPLGHQLSVFFNQHKVVTLLWVLYVVSGIFLLYLKRWARILVILITIYILFDLFVHVIAHKQYMVAVILFNHYYRGWDVPNLRFLWGFLIFFILYLFSLGNLLRFMFKPKVKELFKKA